MPLWAHLKISHLHTGRWLICFSFTHNLYTTLPIFNAVKPRLTPSERFGFTRLRAHRRRKTPGNLARAYRRAKIRLAELIHRQTAAGFVFNGREFPPVVHART